MNFVVTTVFLWLVLPWNQKTFKILWWRV